MWLFLTQEFRVWKIQNSGEVSGAVPLGIASYTFSIKTDLMDFFCHASLQEVFITFSVHPRKRGK